MFKIDIGQHYEELLPDSVEAKESHRLAEATLARVNEMKFQAMLRGYFTTFSTIMKEDLFQEGPKHAPEDTPKLKLRDLLSEAYTRAIRKAPKRVV